MGEVPVYVTHRLRNIIRELSSIAGDVSPRGRGRVAVLSLTRAMTEIECALRHIEGQARVAERSKQDANDPFADI